VLKKLIARRIWPDPFENLWLKLKRQADVAHLPLLKFHVLELEAELQTELNSSAASGTDDGIRSCHVWRCASAAE
jgi:hypothetical protein